MLSSASPSPQSPARPAVIAPGQGELRWHCQHLVDLRLTGSVTADRVSVVEIEIPAGSSTELHRQPYDDETLYVLEGELLVHIDGEDHVAGPGAIVFIPRDVPHAMRAEQRAKVISFGSPAGQERFFRALSVPAPSRELPPPAHEAPHPAAAIAAQQTAFLNGVELLGDAPFAAAA